MPANHSRGTDDQERAPPVAPASAEKYPEGPVRCVEPHARAVALRDQQLLPERHVFEQ